VAANAIVVWGGALVLFLYGATLERRQHSATLRRTRDE
jgi:hypothetical protein